jgi:ABC-type transport system substrate-binding protein
MRRGAALAAGGFIAQGPWLAEQIARAQTPHGRALRIALGGLDTSDPHRHTGSISVQQVYVEGLTSIADDGKAIPYLAESWTVSPDGRRYTFRIRQGVRFHNGRAMTAMDVKANAERVRDKVRRGWLAAPMQLVKTLEAPDPTQFVMEMSEPYGPLLNILSELWILAPESPGWDATIQTPIGTGPYRFGRWIPNERLDAPAFESYWQPGLPRNAGVEFNLRDTVDYTLALRAGDLHVARAPANQMAVLKAEVKPQVWLTTRLNCTGSRRMELVRNSAMRNSVHEKMKQRTAVMTKAMTWERVEAETAAPMARKPPAMRREPM